LEFLILLRSHRPVARILAGQIALIESIEIKLAHLERSLQELAQTLMRQLALLESGEACWLREKLLTADQTVTLHRGLSPPSGS
jgi:hypothetical protein